MTDAMQRTSPAGHWAGAAGGAALVVAGRRLGSWPGLLLSAAGGYLVYRGVSRALLCRNRADSECRPSYELCRLILERYGAGVNAGTDDHLAQAVKEEHHPAGTLIDDVVDEASDDSFPCSDPPAWTPVTGTRLAPVT
jgi:hypothetical protein